MAFGRIVAIQYGNFLAIYCQAALLATLMLGGREWLRKHFQATVGDGRRDRDERLPWPDAAVYGGKERARGHCKATVGDGRRDRDEGLPWLDAAVYGGKERARNRLEAADRVGR